MLRIIFFLLIFSMLSANARQVTPEEAQYIASNFFNSGLTLRGKQAPLRAVQSFHSAESGPYYIFNSSDKAGFVIISGDQRCPKILGYSLDNEFNLNNPIVSTLLDNYSSFVSMLPVEMPIHESWNELAGKSESGYEAVVEPMLDGVEWTQSEPFNDLCPKDNGLPCSVGCVGTAMSMILFHHKWPERSHGECNYIWYKDGGREETINHSFGENPYNWSKIRKSYWDYDSYSDSEARKAVAELCRDCAYASQASFTNWSTGGSTFYVYLSLIDNFDYDTSIRWTSCGCYNHDELCKILKNELNNNRPVFYSSERTPAGVGAHAYVCDGYDSSDMFHFNFGWGGSCDGYYSISTSGLLGVDQNFYYGIQPFVEEKEVLSLLGGGVDFTLTNENNVSCELRHLSGWRSKNMEIGYAVEDKNGFVEYYKTHSQDWSSTSSVFNMTLDRTPNKDGDYIIYPVARLEGSSWQKYPYSDDWQSYVCLNIKNGKKTFSNPEIEYPLEGDRILIDQIAYLVDDADMTATVTFKNRRYNSYSNKVTIPENITVDGQTYIVNRIGDRAFYRCDYLQSVYIPKTVEVIDELAFADSRNLSKLEIAEDSDLKVISNYAFTSCNVKNPVLILPKGLEEIGTEAFTYHGIQNIYLPKSLKRLGYKAFTTYGQTTKENIYVKWTSKEELEEINWYAFDETNTTEAFRPYRVLYVPQGTLKIYQEAVNPEMIDRIEEYDVAGIEAITSDCNTEQNEVYNISGTLVGNSPDELPSGIYIVKEGVKVKKILVK